jgi:ferredoxin
LKIEADRERCIGAGMCALTAPSVFDQDKDDGRVLLRTDCPDEEVLKAVLAAVELCPSGALSIHK